MVAVSVTFEENPLSFFSLRPVTETGGTFLFETVTQSPRDYRVPEGKKKDPPEYLRTESIAVEEKREEKKKDSVKKKRTEEKELKETTTL
ncbi:hypothetical protein CDAR_38691 [Caerostris darwini]|uniref:Uncharacterized protein n=1 Tax=Caerostris darwini TaxID=1538125 RepID=A0AAV4UQF6_9ARAC|nr:hypothetical protein CDAR_38691 [Caerostris darwini]